MTERIPEHLRERNQSCSNNDATDNLEKEMMPRLSPAPHVAVIGAGISGLVAARTLQDHGLKVTVFEKSRGVGGRMATRRIDGGTSFDHGAQYFTARDLRFMRYVNSWMEQGIVSKWPDLKLGSDQKIVVIKNGKIESESKSEDRFVAVPAMNSVCKHLAEHLEVRLATPIARICKVDGGLELVNDAGLSEGVFDRVVVTAPAGQAAVLVAEFPELSRQISEIEMSPCWAAMVSFAAPITDQWVGAFLHDSFLSWAARNSTKPGRNRQADQLVIHAGPDWTKENWERDPTEVSNLMLEEFWRVSGMDHHKSEYLVAHRWKYAIPVNPSHSSCFADESAVMLACGDWTGGSRVEGAFLSGMAAAGKILGTGLPAAHEATSSSQRDPRQRLLFE